MRTAIPSRTEHADELKGRLQREHAGHQKPRLQLRYLLASGQARTRQEVAQLLGGHRHTIGRWLALDAPAGTPVSLAPAVLASLEQALRRPEGCASYEALRPWVRQTHGVEVQDTTLYTPVRTRFRAKRNVARPSPHPKTPTPSPPFRRAVRTSCGRRSRPPIATLSASAAKTTAAAGS